MANWDCQEGICMGFWEVVAIYNDWCMGTGGGGVGGDWFSGYSIVKSSFFCIFFDFLLF